jgi:UDP-N-acetylglucosamine--N-acetylmuramyl-(pentapeptide) pyrophosphoryl-undecaprenol N-acetylglucosamine transferase
VKKLSIIISGGGTGGHIFPAIAIANEIKLRFPYSEILFVGAKDRMEMQRVPKAGYPIIGLWISGFQRKLTISNLLFPIKLILSMLKAKSILKKHKPNVVIGTGGFASAPLLKTANNLGIPTLIQEQNSYAGVTNKWVADKAKAICVAYDNMERYFPKDKIYFTGNPIRQSLLDSSVLKSDALKTFHLKAEQKTILVIGGSLGARTINQTIEKHIADFNTLNCNLIWQSGSFYFKDYAHLDKENIRVLEFIDDMQVAYAAADIIISRAGAGTVSELCLIGKPVIFIPSPNVAENHQYKNAMAIAEQNAGICIEEKDLDKTFLSSITKLLKHADRQKILGANIAQLAKPNATKDIVDLVEKIML